MSDSDARGTLPPMRPSLAGRSTPGVEEIGAIAPQLVFAGNVYILVNPDALCLLPGVSSLAPLWSPTHPRHPVRRTFRRMVPILWDGVGLYIVTRSCVLGSHGRCQSLIPSIYHGRGYERLIRWLRHIML